MEADTRSEEQPARPVPVAEPDPGPGVGRWRRYRWPLAGIGAAVVALVVVVLVWFQPQKLFIDDRVDQAVPAARPTEPSVASPPSSPSDGSGGQPSTTVTTAPPGPVDLATGSFASLDHGTSGTVRVLGLADGRRFVRLEGFATENGPDLFVYLTTNPADGLEGAFDDDYLDLGRLQGNIGDQNYELPGDVDVGAYASVVIWCDRFDSAFGAADLAAT